MDYTQYSQYSGAPGYEAYAQQGQQAQPTPPTIRNPFAPPPPQRPSHPQAGDNSFDPEYEAQIAQWQSAYASQDQNSRKGNPNEVAIGSRGQGTASGTTTTATTATDKTTSATTTDKPKTVIRSGGGQSWEDDTLLEWDPTQFRIQVGNLAGEVTDDSLLKAFGAWEPSKARVIRDKRTTKSKGYGFVAFVDGDKGFEAAKAMKGKYIGSHPVTIQRSKTNLRPQSKPDLYKNRKYKKDKKQDKEDRDVLHANTGAHIEKKPVKNAAGLKIIG